METFENSKRSPAGVIGLIAFVLLAAAGVVVFVNREAVPQWIPGILAGLIALSATVVVAMSVRSFLDEDRHGVEWASVTQGAAVAGIVATIGGFTYGVLEAVLELPRLSAGVFGTAVAAIWLVSVVMIRSSGQRE